MIPSLITITGHEPWILAIYFTIEFAEPSYLHQLGYRGSHLVDEVLSKSQIVLTMLTGEAVKTWSGTLRRSKDLQ